ncbi:hypothetical protein Taro_018183 [Colocasia esculenta]|uniref:DUF7804 domain-containing protein n=1 Tax=Colocasia esculenta TaxID=4460 RepID=A0A843UVE7_COLES|nr:hypothetical protein [Colocasia esculenta]
MALRLWCGGGGTSLFVENRSAARLRPIRPSLLVVPKIRRSEGAILPATTISAQPRAVVCRCSTIHVDHDHARDERGPLALVRPCRRHELHDDDDNEEAGKKRGGGTASEKMDQWMQECIVEIVRNIGEAPFLVYVFCNNDGSASGGGEGVGAALKLVMEAADPENWLAIRSRWDRGVASPPGGVILVEELQIRGDDDDGGTTRAREGRNTTLGGGKPGDHGAAAEASKTWGVLVQGWGGVDCAACYILSTCRVRSVFGFCTHFCLTRARCFEDTADVQLKKLWLVGGGTHRHCHRQ